MNHSVLDWEVQCREDMCILMGHELKLAKAESRELGVYFVSQPEEFCHFVIPECHTSREKQFEGAWQISQWN